MTMIRLVKKTEAEEEDPLVEHPTLKTGDPQVTCRYAHYAGLLLGMVVILACGVHVLGGPYRNLRHSQYESLYKFGDPADLAHYKESVEGLCNSADLEAQPLTVPHVRPRGGLCQSSASQRDFPCNWTRTWACPGTVNLEDLDSDSKDKDGIKGVSTDDASVNFHCCCKVPRSRSRTLSRKPFADDAEPAPPPETVRIKVVTYNLFWWNLFGVHKGNKGTAGGVIVTSHVQEPIDLIAFQECRDKDRVLKDAGLLISFQTFEFHYEKCIAIRKDAWMFIKTGEADVAGDVYWNNYGHRGVAWIRLVHKTSGLRVFFANHHGPLAVNSGGTCGGQQTARNILKVIGTHSEPGDVIFLLGDFNANSASHTVQELRGSLVHVQSGSILGGIDHTFTNLKPSTVVAMQDMGSGGSDHHAISTVFEVNTGDYSQPDELRQDPQLSRAILGRLRKTFPKDDWDHFWCGLQYNGVSYNAAGQHTSWIIERKKAATPDWCCKWCQRDTRCKAFRFEGIPGGNRTRCTLMSDYEGGPKDSAYLFVASGLAAETAVQEVESSFLADRVVATKV